jgi:hypothetical protein
MVGSLAPADVLADDVTISCKDPPDKSARIAVRKGTLVNTTKDKPEKRCTFSVEGARADSPPAERVIEGINSFRSGGRIETELKQGKIDNLAYALLASAPVKELPSDLGGVLRKDAALLGQCIGAFYSSDQERIEFPLSAGVCRTLPETSGGYLEITATWGGGNFVSSLYIPRNYRQRPPIPR